jgi:4'-phosphopantetheinyl transferase
MPLYKEWNVGDYGAAAIWKIEEPESFFKEHTGLESDIKNEKRRMEYFAGRYLLLHLEEEFPLHTIQKDEHDKPRIDENRFFFSISHSWPYIAVVVDPRNEAGIDIQTWHPNIGDIQHKFLSPDEQQMFQNDPKLLTVAWCAKEAVYKWYGKRGVDFIGHLPIENFNHKEDNNNIIIYFKLSKIPKMIYVKGFINTDFACSYMDGTQDWAIY